MPRNQFRGYCYSPGSEMDGSLGSGFSDGFIMSGEAGEVSGMSLGFCCARLDNWPCQSEMRNPEGGPEFPEMIMISFLLC